MRLFSGLVVCLSLFSGLWSSHALGLGDLWHFAPIVGTDPDTELNAAAARLLSEVNGSNSPGAASSSSASSSSSSSSLSSASSSSLASNPDSEEEEEDLLESPIDGAGSESEAGIAGDLLPDEIWLKIAQYFDFQAWLNFIHTCYDFNRVGNDPIAIGYTFLNEAMDFIPIEQYEHACFRCWQGVFSMLHHFQLLDEQGTEHMRYLLNPQHPNLVHAMSFLSGVAIDFSRIPHTPRRLLMHLWIQGTLLFSNGGRGSAAFTQALANAFRGESFFNVLADGAAQRLRTLLNEPINTDALYSAALVGLRLLLSDHLLSKATEKTSTIMMVGTAISNVHPYPTRYVATQQLQAMLRQGVLPMEYQRIVLRAIIQAAGDPRLSLQGRMLILNTVDDPDINGMLTPELRRNLLASMPIFIRNENVGDMAEDYLEALLHANALSPEELVLLGNNLHPLIHDPSDAVRVRVISLLTEGVLNRRLPYSFRQACTLAFIELLNDPSPAVREAIQESLILLQALPREALPSVVEMLLLKQNGESSSSSS